jgi:hypothetical protein
MKNKFLIPIVVVVATVLLAACGDQATNQQTVKPVDKESTSDCLTGTEKTVVGLKYKITGTENHTIQGKSMDLCCWQTGESQKIKKICTDRTTSPVGYTVGVLMEKNNNIGDFIKTMERYQKNGKSCQQFFNADGSTQAENCQ